jgi:2-polyprenyl-6-methoxyphenol hydroxylase-like FAD-dependent oxidoreductase
MSLTAPVLISGAGISGLAFAQGLLKAGIPFRIFERDPALNVRSQGYRVRLNPIGIDALNQVLPAHLFTQLKASCAHNTLHLPLHLNAITGAKSELKFNGVKPPPQAGGSEESLNADRSVVRSVLIKGLENFVEFGKEFLKYELTPNGITVHFTDKSTAEGILLVGADGTKSRVRKQLLPNHVFMDTEGRWFYGKTTITPELLSELSEHVANGFALVQDRTKEVPFSLLCEPVKFQDNEFRSGLPRDYIYWVLCSRKDNFEIDDAQLFKLSSEEAVAETLKLTAHWDSSFRALFSHQDEGQTSVLRIDSAMPDLPVWETQSSVTLIGDSVHAMSPTSVVGAVSALRSAATLSKVLAEEGISAQSLKKYEDEMRQYTGEAIKKSVWGGKMLFGMRGFNELKPAAV